MPDNGTIELDHEGPELIASEVDELTHAELLCLYHASEENIRFSKSIQWRIIGGTLILFLIFGLLAPSFSKHGDFVKILTVLTSLVAAVSICVLVIMQSWQGTERDRIALILNNLSSLARSVYNTKSASTANIERYILLCFMASAILIGSFLALSRLMRWFTY